MNAIVSKRKILFFIFLLAFLFSTFLYHPIQKFIGFTYMDELIMLILLISLCVHLLSKKLNKDSFAFLGFICIYVFFLMYSLFFGVNTKTAVLTDAVIFLKPFVAYFVVTNLNFDFTSGQEKFLSRTALVCAIVTLVVALSGLRTMVYFYAHPANVAMNVSCFSMLYLVMSEGTKKNILIGLGILAIGLLTERSKNYGFVCIAVVMLLYGKKLKFSLFPVILLLIAIGLGLYVSWEKIYFYYIAPLQRNAIYNTDAARLALFAYGFRILIDFFPLGPGFGSFANYASAIYYSPIYLQYKLFLVHGLDRDGSFICDTFFPQLAQFGIVGTILFFFFWHKILKKMKRKYAITNNDLHYKFGILIICFFAIESVAASTFVQPQGMVMMMLLGLLTKSDNCNHQCLKVD